MTIGELLDAIKDLVKRLIDSIPIKETAEKVWDVTSSVPGDMRSGFTEIINGEQWGWIFAFVFCVVALVILWKSMANVVDIVVKALIIVAHIVLVLAVLVCLLKGRIDIAVILALVVIVMLVKNHFYPKSPS